LVEIIAHGHNVAITQTYFFPRRRKIKNYIKTPLIRISWDGEPSGYAKIPDNWIFL